MNTPLPILPTATLSNISSTQRFQEFDFEALMGVDASKLTEPELRELVALTNSRIASPHVRRAEKKKESDKLSGKKSKKVNPMEGLL